MNIVIAGAGDVGRYIAAMLARELHNVVLIDKDAKTLEEASWQMDVAVRHGTATDWQLLDSLLEVSPHLFLALTDSDETNLVACTIAKNLGYPKTIARIRDNRYLNRSRLDFGRLFAVNDLIGPELLAANDIYKYLMSPGSLAIETFAHGAVQLRTLKIPSRFQKDDLPIASLDLPHGILVGLIRRVVERVPTIIFPHGQDHILPGDEVTFIGEKEPISKIHKFFGVEQGTIRSVVIVGGSLEGVNLTHLLEAEGINVRLIEQDTKKCIKLSEELPKSTIINHDGTDRDFLLSEKVGQVDALIACTKSDESNIMAALLSKELGCENVVVLLSKPGYTELVAELGISHAISPRISAANKILAAALSGNVASIISFYENQAEVIEIKVSMNSKVLGIPIKELGPLLPQDFIIVMIQNRGRILMAHGNRIISPGDTVIVVTNPKHLRELEKIF